MFFFAFLVVLCLLLTFAGLVESKFFPNKTRTDIILTPSKNHSRHIETEATPWCPFVVYFLDKNCLGVPRGESYTYIAPSSRISFTYEKIKTVDAGSPCFYLRVKKASVKISRAVLGHGSEVTPCARQWSAMLNYLDGNRCAADGGHIFGNHLGGRGVVANVFPQSREINRGLYSGFEAEIFNCLAVSKSTVAMLTWTFTYNNQHRYRPTWVEYTTYYQGRCPRKTKRFPNIVDLLPAARSLPFLGEGEICAFQHRLLTHRPCRDQLPQDGSHNYPIYGDGTITLTYQKFATDLQCSVLRVVSGYATISARNLNPNNRQSSVCFDGWSKEMNLANIRLGYENRWRSFNDKCPAEKGHILAHSLGGPEKMWNVFPQDPTMNTGGYEKLEKQIAKCLTDNFGQEIRAHLSWEFNYNKYATKPYQVRYDIHYTYLRGVARDPKCSEQEQSNTFDNFYSKNLELILV